MISRRDAAGNEDRERWARICITRGAPFEADGVVAAEVQTRLGLRAGGTGLLYFSGRSNSTGSPWKVRALSTSKVVGSTAKIEFLRSK